MMVYVLEAAMLTLRDEDVSRRRGLAGRRPLADSPRLVSRTD